MKRPHAVISLSDLQEKGPSPIYFVRRIILSTRANASHQTQRAAVLGHAQGQERQPAKLRLHNMLLKGWAPGPFARHRLRPWAAGLGCTGLLPRGGLRERVVEGPFSSGKFYNPACVQ